MTELVRAATREDVPALQAIYAHHVLNGLGTFEETPPDLEEMTQRLQSVLDRHMPWLVAEAQGRVVAYAYATPFRPRSAYRFTVEDSVYVAPDHMGQGHGKRVLTQLIATCTTMGMREMLAVIGDSGNEGSIALHKACGFANQSVLRNVGVKFERWVDVVIMQKSLIRN